MTIGSIPHMLVFDIDGTLTYSRQAMKMQHEQAFLDLIKHRCVYLVTGSDLPKVLEQVPEQILSNVQGVFTCLGGELYSKDYKTNKLKLSFSNDFDFPGQLYLDLIDILSKSKYQPKTGCHIEDRPGGLINFSIVGRKATLEDRNNYALWDIQHNERVKIISELKKKYPELEFSAGGQISIDISSKGSNKSQVLDYFRDLKIANPICFFGDKMEEHGNDYPLANVLEEENSKHPCATLKNYCFKVNDPDHTIKVLKEFLPDNTITAGEFISRLTNTKKKEDVRSNPEK